MDLDDIQAKIPHRPPMLLLDAVLELSPDCIVCEKTFRLDEFFHQGHYPGNPIIPGFMLCEAAAQAGAVLAASSQPAEGVPLLTRASEIKFKQVVRPGDTIRIEATVNERLGGAMYFSARVTKAGRLAASLTFAVKLQTPE